MVRRLAINILIFVGVLAGVSYLLTPPALRTPSVGQIELAPLHVAVPAEEFDVEHKDRIQLPNNMMCPEWAQLAIDAGWQEEDLAKLDSIIHRESRCFTLVHYTKDPNGGSYGLTQVNGYWCSPSKWYPSGYLQTFGILDTCEELLNPRINLISARIIWVYSRVKNNDGWLPWQK